ncbi:MAG: BrxE family protein [Planctomycetales bacterium]|nr:BrxE family protein [Planctomycetales bacterium]
MDIDVKRIAALRMAVARQGEMDRSKWWNTKGLLSRVGELAISRGFPKSHVFARARAAFAVASSRSEEVFNPPDSYTLWRLPVEIEDQIEDAWSGWLESPDEWKDLLERIDAAGSNDLVAVLTTLELVSERTVNRTKGLRRADDLKSVPLKMNGESVIEAIEVLAVAHGSSEPGKLAVPFIREEDFPT